MSREDPEDRITLDAGLRARMLANLARFPRRERDAASEAGEALRGAAVAVVILGDADGNACFVITRRAPRLKSHGGQWALPGGRLDPGETARDAALRETHEEIGLDLDRNSVLGELDDYPTRSGYLIRPVVLWAGADIRLSPNPAEVSAVYRVPLRVLDSPDVPRLRRIPESDRPIISIPMLGTNVHAPTAAVLYQTVEVALRGNDTRVAHFDQPVFAWR